MREHPHVAGLAEFAALDPEHEVFPRITAGDLVFAMSPGPLGDLRMGTARYGDHELHRLHWYAPAAVGDYPAVLFVHSGSWSGGDATSYLRYASDLAHRGFVTATMDYRLTPESSWPDPLHDVCNAVAWMRDDPLEVGILSSAIALAGASAGAHLACMAALSPTAPMEVGDVAAAVLWYPPLRLATMAAVPGARASVEALLGGLDPATLERASPMAHLSAATPPVLTMTGSEDPICPERDAREFHTALTSHGVPNQLVVVPGEPHGFDFTRRGYTRSFAALLEFLSKIVGAALAPKHMPTRR